MGTPQFAVASLEILYNAGYAIVGVITSVDKMGGRGRKTVIESAVKKYAVEKGLNVLQPKNLKSPKFNQDLKALNADLQIVVAFRMLPEVVWNMPKLGTYNLHGSLLPQYRGAAPINWAVINGEISTGVTTFKLKHEIDTGSILMQKEIPIYQTDNATDVHDRMMYVGADLVLESVKKIIKGDIVLMEQDDSKTSHAPKLNKENTLIDFTQDTVSVYNFIRGLSLYPGAWFKIGKNAAKIFKAEIEIEEHNLKPGKLISDNKKFIKVACSDGYINIEDIQISGKRKMAVNELLNGFDINPFI
jgi:methionyl-tRNA formyltransferase